MLLNEEQQAAVEYIAGPQVIVAGPGSGKTRVIISKIEYLVSEIEIDPGRILAITFSNKASAEIGDRLGEAFPYRSHEFNVHTFHALCWNIIQEFAAEAGYKPGVKVLDQTASWVLVRRHIEEFGLHHYLPLNDPFRYLFDLLGHVSKAKDEGVTSQDYAEYAHSKRAQFEAIKESLTPDEAEEQLAEVEKHEELSRFYTHYQELLLEENSTDFGDQISMALDVLSKHPNVRRQIQSRWDYILVDEFQDTNIAQIELLKLLTRPDAKVCVVGDPDQSIYRFRGASFASFIRFDEEYPNRQPFALTQNYRSTKNVLGVAARLIAHNADRYQAEKPVWTDSEDGMPVTILKAPSFGAEAEAVADEIVSILMDIPVNERRFGDFAILYRAHSHRDEFITAFERHGIPYKVVSGAGFYKKEEIKDIMALVKCASGPTDGVSLHRAFSLADWSIPSSDLKSFSRWINTEKIGLSEAFARINECPDLNPDGTERIKVAVSYILELRVSALELTASDLCRSIFEHTQILKRYLFDDSVDSRQRAANLAKYLRKVQDFQEASEDKSITAFTEYQDYLIESGADEEEAEIDDSRDAVQLMTVHAAKGLEWPYVFVVSLSSARFPTSRRSDAIPFPDDLVRETAPEGDFHMQEERRLAYVAFTRAQQRLYLSCVEKKGKRASVFVQEVSADGASIIEKGVPEVPFDPSIESASRLAVAERDIRRQVIRVMDKSADVEVIRPYVELLAAIRQAGTDPSSAQQRITNLKAHIDPALYESIEEMLERQLVVTSVTVSTPPEPIYMSYSRMSTYEDCPLGYRFSYELKIPGKPKPYFAFGSSVHDSLNTFLQSVIDGNDPSLDDLKAAYNETWQSEGYVIPSQEAGYRLDGESSLETFYRRYQAEKVIPLHLEWKFTLPVGGHFITGVVDRIDPLGDGTCSIYDYKTGKACKQKEVDESLQLTIYALAARDCLGLRADKLSLYFLKTNEIITTTRTDAQLDEVKEHVLKVVESIQARKFEPVYEAFKCARCDYAGICPVTEG
ncbi:MAG: ATP-dependent helicase [Armatimonadota bacterium]